MSRIPIAFNNSVQIQWTLVANHVPDAAFPAIGAFQWKQGVTWPQGTNFTRSDATHVTLDNNNNVDTGAGKTVGAFDYLINVTYTSPTNPPTTETITLDPGIDNLPPGGMDGDKEHDRDGRRQQKR